MENAPWKRDLMRLQKYVDIGRSILLFVKCLDLYDVGSFELILVDLLVGWLVGWLNWGLTPL